MGTHEKERDEMHKTEREGKRTKKERRNRQEREWWNSLESDRENEWERGRGNIREREREEIHKKEREETYEKEGNVQEIYLKKKARAKKRTGGQRKLWSGERKEEKLKQGKGEGTGRWRKGNLKIWKEGRNKT